MVASAHKSSKPTPDDNIFFERLVPSATPNARPGNRQGIAGTDPRLTSAFAQSRANISISNTNNDTSDWQGIVNARQRLPANARYLAHSSKNDIATRRRNLQISLLTDVSTAIEKEFPARDSHATSFSQDVELFKLMARLAERYKIINAENAQSFCRDLRTELRTLEREWRDQGSDSPDLEKIQKNLLEKLSSGQEQLKSWVNSVFKDEQYEHDIASRAPAESTSSRKLTDAVPSQMQQLVSGAGELVSSSFSPSAAHLSQSPALLPGSTSAHSGKSREIISVEKESNIVTGVQKQKISNDNIKIDLRKPNVSNADVKRIFMGALAKNVSAKTKQNANHVFDELEKQSISIESFLRFIGEEKDCSEIKNKVTTYVYMLRYKRIISVEPGIFTKNLSNVLALIGGLKIYGYMDSHGLKIHKAKQSGTIKYREKLQPMFERARKAIENDTWKVQNDSRTGEAEISVDDDAVQTSNTISSLIEQGKVGEKRKSLQIPTTPPESKKSRIDRLTSLNPPLLSNESIKEAFMAALPPETLQETKQIIEHVLNSLVKKSFDLRKFLEFLGEPSQSHKTLKDKAKAYILALLESFKSSNEKPEIIDHKDLLWVLGKVMSFEMYSEINHRLLSFSRADGLEPLKPTKGIKVFLEAAQKAIKNNAWKVQVSQENLQINLEDSLISKDTVALQAAEPDSHGYYSALPFGGSSADNEKISGCSPESAALTQSDPAVGLFPEDDVFLELCLEEGDPTESNVFSPLWNSEIPPTSTSVGQPLVVDQQLTQVKGVALEINQIAQPISDPAPLTLDPVFSDDSDLWKSFLENPYGDFETTLNSVSRT